jgi:hypothetical protein
MRKKAESNGNLQSNAQQKVDTKVVESKSVIVVEQADPQVVYVPTYSPVVVYGPPVYPYPPIYYPPPGYYATGMAISFGVGVAMGAFWSGGWGWNCGWGSSNVNINVHNNFNRVSNFNSARGTGNWQHNPQHRGGAPYRDRATADRYGGAARGDSMANRGSQGGDFSSPRADSGGFNDSVGSGARPGEGPGGGDRIGNQDLSRSGGGRDSGAFGGDARGYNGSQTRAASSRGASSMSRGASRGGRRR